MVNDFNVDLIMNREVSKGEIINLSVKNFAVSGAVWHTHKSLVGTATLPPTSAEIVKKEDDLDKDVEEDSQQPGPMNLILCDEAKQKDYGSEGRDEGDDQGKEKSGKKSDNEAKHGESDSDTSYISGSSSSSSSSSTSRSEEENMEGDEVTMKEESHEREDQENHSEVRRQLILQLEAVRAEREEQEQTLIRAIKELEASVPTSSGTLHPQVPPPKALLSPTLSSDLHPPPAPPPKTLLSPTPPVTPPKTRIPPPTSSSRAHRPPPKTCQSDSAPPRKSFFSPTISLPKAPLLPSISSGGTSPDVDGGEMEDLTVAQASAASQLNPGGISPGHVSPSAGGGEGEALTGRVTASHVPPGGVTPISPQANEGETGGRVALAATSEQSPLPPSSSTDET